MNKPDISERNFEQSVELGLLGDPDLPLTTTSYYRKLATAGTDGYSRELCLHLTSLFDFVTTTQPQTWAKLVKQYGGNDKLAREQFSLRLATEISKRGSLDVLRKGVSDHGCKFELAYFRPETSLNPTHQQHYNANILGVARQLHFSTRRPNDSIDIVLFLNGLPLITIELKNPLTGQTYLDAISQYRERDASELIFQNGRCLAHFAVDPDQAWMATQLRGSRTIFRPFNRGTEHGAGNPPNPTGFRTAYLWEQVWQRDSMLDLVNKFVQFVEEEDEQGHKTGSRELVFPRYHQLTAVRNMVAHASKEGAGRTYLVQHSAGSGKTKTIAWLAHHLASLHDARDQRVFNSVVVVSDRRILDHQLQRAVRSFAQVVGLVEAIDEDSSQLREALEKGKGIIVTTMQKFPIVLKNITELAGERFAVIMDEAHSSQQGGAARSLKDVLSVGGLAEAEQVDGSDKPDDEDEINTLIEVQMRGRGRLPHVSFFAFTATPKAKTLQTFGTPYSDGSYVPFSLYSMRQAIEEGYILDVLRNYTTFRVYFSLLKMAADDPRYEKRTAIQQLTDYAGLHAHAIATKATIMIEHFHNHTRHKIAGLAKAMVVTPSRLHAVLYALAFRKYLKEHNLPYKVLVAFSGRVRDPETNFEYTEAEMNGISDIQTASTFKQPAYRFLIVADKFQTGFDEPLLHTMYVDKRLRGVKAVQTLSRLNRTYKPDKEDTMVLDFVNRADDIQKAFQQYYQTTILREGTDLNSLYDLQTALFSFYLFTDAEVDEFASVYFSGENKPSTQAQLHIILDPLVKAFTKLNSSEQAALRGKLISYIDLYSFLANILTFADASLEKLYQFARLLLRKLPISQDTLPATIRERINMDSYRVQETGSGEIKLLGKDGQLHAPADRTEQTLAARDRAPLSRILEYVNEHYGTDFTDEDKLNSFTDDMRRRMESNRNLVNAMNVAVNPRVEDRLLAFRGFFSRTLEAMIEANFNIYQKITDDATLHAMIRQMLFDQLADRLITQTPPLELSINCWDMPTHSIGASELEIATQQRRLNVKPSHPLPCLTLNPQPPPPSRAAPLSPRLRRCYCPYCAGSRTPLLLL